LASVGRTNRGEKRAEFCTTKVKRTGFGRKCMRIVAARRKAQAFRRGIVLGTATEEEVSGEQNNSHNNIALGSSGRYSGAHSL